MTFRRKLPRMIGLRIILPFLCYLAADASPLLAAEPVFTDPGYCQKLESQRRYEVRILEEETLNTVLKSDETKVNYQSLLSRLMPILRQVEALKIDANHRCSKDVSVSESAREELQSFIQIVIADAQAEIEKASRVN